MTEPPAGWGAPGPDEPERDPDTPWRGFSPPPGWSPPPKEPMSKGEFALGLASCVVLNILLLVSTATALLSTFGEAFGLVILGINIAAIVVPAVKGHKGFAVGFASGYAVLFVLAFGACFILLSQL